MINLVILDLSNFIYPAIALNTVNRSIRMNVGGKNKFFERNDCSFFISQILIFCKKNPDF